jgi:nucleoid-associated protein YgaU
MSDPADAGKRSDLAVIAGAAGLGAVLVAGAVAVVIMRDTPSEDVAVTRAPVPSIDVSDASPSPDATAPLAAFSSPGGEAPAGDPRPPAPPRFDLVRIDPTGNALIAGQAGPLAEITLALDGVPLEVVTADASGQFVAMLAIVPSEVPRVLSLRAVSPDGLALLGEGTVIIAPFGGDALVADARTVAMPADASPAPRPEGPGHGDITDVAPAGVGREADTPSVSGHAMAPPVETTPPAPLHAPRPAGDTTLAAAPDAPDRPGIGQGLEAPEPTPGTPPGPVIVLADRDGIRMLQGPDAQAETRTDLQLDAISYDTAGAVTLAGRGPAATSVRVMLDNLPVTLGEIGPGGRWSLDLPDVEPGSYTLRLEQLASDGTVTDEIETPFLREDPERIRENPMLVENGASVITVQQGFTLWGIAEANFGDGILYLQIFAENRDAIRDPDLIFPGQIFALPDLPRGERAE